MQRNKENIIKLTVISDAPATAAAATAFSSVPYTFPLATATAAATTLATAALAALVLSHFCSPGFFAQSPLVVKLSKLNFL